MQYNFYDTCALLNYGDSIFGTGEKFYISNLTLREIEGIKTAFNKDADVKYKARKLAYNLIVFKDDYQPITYQHSWDTELNKYEALSDNMDSRIILSALLSQNQDISFNFISNDSDCALLAQSVGLHVQFLLDEDDTYYGYTKFIPKDDNELANFYNNIHEISSTLDLLNHEYLLIEQNNQIIDKYIYENKELIRLPNFLSFDSNQFGNVKPKDSYQFLAMDSLNRNQITLLRGPAGSGKSLLAMSYLFHQLERGKIDKIIIFCNTVAASGSAKLGYYPGTKDEKLLDSQIGNFLSSKLGDKTLVEEMIAQGTLVLLPMSDIRGYDTSGLHAGIYITEAQNMDVDLMKLALQRIGDDSICILDGDDKTQVDLGIYAGANNGLRRVSKVFRGEDIYGEVTMPNIYRSKIANIAQRM